MSGKEELNNALHEAQEAVAAGQQWDKTSAEKRLDFVGEYRFALASGAALVKITFPGNSVQSVLVAAAAGGALSSDNTKDALDVIKSKIDTFVEDSKVAIKILDEIGKIHPFVQGDSQTTGSSCILCLTLFPLDSCGVSVQGCPQLRVNEA